MPGRSSHVTIDHDEIRHWVDARGGVPAQVKGTEHGDRTGVLRIDFPGYSGGASLEEIEWDEFFDKFEDSHLAFVYQDTTARGQPSNFNKLISRESVDLRTGATKSRAPGAGAGAGAPRGRKSVSRVSAARTARRRPPASGSTPSGEVIVGTRSRGGTGRSGSSPRRRSGRGRRR